MRYTRNIDGLKRLKTNKSYKHSIEYIRPKKEEHNYDTKARCEINNTIFKMLEQNKSDIEIEMYLRNRYPNYSEYIPKMIRHHISKINEKKAKNIQAKEAGDAR